MSFETEQHLMTTHPTECALTRLDEFRTITRRQAHRGALACKGMPRSVSGTCLSQSNVRRSTNRQYSNRTANYIVLTDCAFLFFRGLQLRVWDPEIECDLPCHENVFDAVHPFTHPDFSFKRSLTAQQAFGAMFTSIRLESGHDLGLTMLDSFVLIHSKPCLTE